MGTSTEWPLLGLQEDALLPGEERSLGAPSLDTASVKAATALVGQGVVLVTVAHAAELPSLVGGRWATRCQVLRADDSGITFRGEQRVRLASVTGLAPPFQARVEKDATPAPGAEDLPALLEGAHALLAALGAGAAPRAPQWRTGLTAALSALLRAVVAPQEAGSALDAPLPDALRQAATTLHQRAPGEHASVRLEDMVSQLRAARPDLPPELRQRLWAQTVEILRTLDVYDTTSGRGDDEFAVLQRRLQQAGLPKDAREVAKRELRLLRSMETHHHDFPSYRGHLEFMARLPWHPETVPPPDLDTVARVLDRDHSGLEKPKRRILESLAVRVLGGRSRSTILCLAGPPGVGKTSLARSIAEALQRKFVRVALGGVHDESEIRGHRLTYVAAAAGRILQGLATAGSAAPVMLLDELDKVGTDRQRSPVGALHEVLDPEQNAHFHDNYLGVPYDLSHILFICTANDLTQIHPTLLDRLEVVELEGYLAAEKVEIARQHLLPGLRADSGLPQPLAVEPAALDLVIEGYTREAGVRQLRRALEAVHRHRALARVRGGGEETLAHVTAEEVRRILGPPRHLAPAPVTALPLGVAMGLSVGTGGGSIIHVETALLPGKGQLHLTGRLGEVMRESAQTALAHLRRDAALYGVEPSRLEGDVCVHVPEASVPKDGPSAGVAVGMALLSAATGRPLPADVAMTGELTLSGQVLPVGGVRAKVLAAERAGARCVILPQENAADVPEGVRLQVVLVRSAMQVVRELWPA